jgi:hypothetical protein
MDPKVNRASAFVRLYAPRSSIALKSARPLRFEPGGLGCFAHAEIAVDQASALMALGWYARGWLCKIPPRPSTAIAMNRANLERVNPERRRLAAAAPPSPSA